MNENTTQPKTQLKGVLLLLLTAIIWGTSFVAQSLGSDSVPAFTFMGTRTLIGAFFLLPFILIRDKVSARKLTAEQVTQRKATDKKTIKYGMIVGLFLCAATNFQQFAFYQPGAGAGKIAFITAMYMFFVPILGLLFFKKRIPLITWICIILGFIGLYFLCFKTASFGAVSFGDILSFICAIFFTLQILFIEKFAPECDGIKLSCVQFFTAGIITMILTLIFERPDLAQIKAGLLPILYSGIMSCGFAYTMQVVGQKYCEATIASLLMCMESVFATLSAAIYLHETLTGREIAGCIIMFTAIVISQLSDKFTKK
ncbi:MAG: DMT family transporter [Treponema sp.]|nr:DMT family transporter [Treponema sp.]